MVRIEETYKFAVDGVDIRVSAEFGEAHHPVRPHREWSSFAIFCHFLVPVDRVFNCNLKTLNVKFVAQLL